MASFKDLDREIKAQIQLFSNKNDVGIWMQPYPASVLGVFEGDDIISLSVEDDIAPNGQYEIGNSTSKYIEVVLALNANTSNRIFENRYIAVTFTSPLNNNVGYFIIEEAKIDKIKKQIIVKGFDYMILANKLVDITKFDFVTNYSPNIYRYTIRWYMDAIAKMMGVTVKSYTALEWTNSPLVNKNTVLAYDADALSKMSVRALISDIGEVSCSNAYVFKNELIFTFAKTTSNTVDANNYFKLDFSEETAIKPMPSVLVIDTNGGYAARGTENFFTISKNVLCNNAETIVDEIYNKVKDFAYKPYTMEWMGNPSIATGDQIRIYPNINDLGNSTTTVVTRQKLTYAGGLRATMEAKALSKTAATTSLDDIKGSVNEIVAALNKINEEQGVFITQDFGLDDLGKKVTGNITGDKDGLRLNCNGWSYDYKSFDYTFTVNEASYFTTRTSVRLTKTGRLYISLDNPSLRYLIRKHTSRNIILRSFSCAILHPDPVNGPPAEILRRYPYTFDITSKRLVYYDTTTSSYKDYEDTSNQIVYLQVDYNVEWCQPSYEYTITSSTRCQVKFEMGLLL